MIVFLMVLILFIGGGIGGAMPSKSSTEKATIESCLDNECSNEQDI